MKLNYSILAAALTETEGKTVSYDLARHVWMNKAKGKNAARLLAALPAYKAAILGGCEAAQIGFLKMQMALENIVAGQPQKEVKTPKEKRPNIALIGGVETRFDRVTRRKMRGASAGKYQYLGAGEVIQISGWQSRKFKAGDKALFWKLKETVKQAIIDKLYQFVISEEDCESIFNQTCLKVAEMNVRVNWFDPADGYPEQLKNLLFAMACQSGVKWFEENRPMAFQKKILEKYAL